MGHGWATWRPGRRPARSARASVVSGGLACVVGVGLLMMAMPSLYAYDSEEALAEMAAAG